MKNLLLAVVGSFAICVNIVLAAPTLQLNGGKTSVKPSEEFVTALDSLGVTLSVVEPASLNDKGRVLFPIAGGAIDLDPESPKVEIFHTGGLALKKGDTEVKLLNFIIAKGLFFYTTEYTTEEPTLFGLVTVNGNVVDRIPLFDLELTKDPRISKRGTLIIKGVVVTLNAVAAAALNDVFGVKAFAEGFPIGNAAVRARILDTEKDGHDDYDDYDDHDDDDYHHEDDDDDHDDDDYYHHRHH